MYKVPVFLQNKRATNYTADEARDLKDSVRPVCFDYASPEICEHKLDTIFDSCNDCILYGEHCDGLANVPFGLDNLLKQDVELGFKNGMTCSDVIQKSKIIKHKLGLRV